MNPVHAIARLMWRPFCNHTGSRLITVSTCGPVIYSFRRCDLCGKRIVWRTL